MHLCNKISVKSLVIQAHCLARGVLEPVATAVDVDLAALKLIHELHVQLLRVSDHVPGFLLYLAHRGAVTGSASLHRGFNTDLMRRPSFLIEHV